MTAYSFFLKAYAKEHNITKVTELGKAVTVKHETCQNTRLPTTDPQKASINANTKLLKNRGSAPQNTPPPYLYFFNENRTKILEANPGTFSDVAKRAGAQWRALSDSEKQPFVNLSKEAKVKYQQELEAF